MESSTPDPGPRVIDRFDATEAAALAAARAAVLDRIERACRRVGRDPSTVTLVAVSKTVPVVRLRAAVAAGLTLFGENRVQEGAEKAAQLAAATWHLVGPLQSNKARRAVETFAAIETLDGPDLAARLDRIAGELRPGIPLPVLVQVNVDDDPGKAGFAPAALPAVLPLLLAHPNLAVGGLMTVGRLVDDPAMARPTFMGLRRLSEDLRRTHERLGATLSMGMSDDFEVAVEEGATIVRIGRALFGARPTAGG